GNGHPLYLRPELDVATHREPRIERVGLEHHSPIGPGLERWLSVHEHFAFRGRDEARRDHQERRFPAARRADDARELAVRHRDRDALEGPHLAMTSGKAHGDVGDRDPAHCWTISTPGNATRW